MYNQMQGSTSHFHIQMLEVGSKHVRFNKIIPCYILQEYIFWYWATASINNWEKPHKEREELSVSDIQVNELLIGQRDWERKRSVLKEGRKTVKNDFVFL